MAQEIVYILVSELIVAMLAFIGVVTLSLNKEFLHKIVFYLVSFAAGSLFGAAFLHLLARSVELLGYTATTGFFVLTGIVVSFLMENLIHWHHHHFAEEEHVKPVSYIILFGDGIHNFVDGMVIAASYLVSIPLGIATTVAVALHEIPQEIGDFGVLVHSGWEVKKALLFNFLSAITGFLGVFLVLLLSSEITGLISFLIPFTAGNFIYVAGSDLLPELEAKRDSTFKYAAQMLVFVLGIAVMYSLKLLPF